MNNRLYYGDDLQVLREEIREETVDPICLQFRKARTEDKAQEPK
jgi:hypothetical protein